MTAASSHGPPLNTIQLLIQSVAHTICLLLVALASALSPMSVGKNGRSMIGLVRTNMRFCRCRPDDHSARSRCGIGQKSEMAAGRCIVLTGPGRHA